MLSLVLHEDERRAVAELRTADPDVPWDTVTFSAKEAVFKAWFPITHRWLGFEDAKVTIHPASGEIDVRLLIDVPATHAGVLNTMRGRWTADDQYVVTAVAVPGARG